jgi:GntR family transcriptional regulator/MocR family aminotransferase
MVNLLLGMLDLERGSDETLMHQLTNQLRRLITGGRLKPGQGLPSSRNLARSLDVSRNTVSFAIEQLAPKAIWPLLLAEGRS